MKFLINLFSLSFLFYTQVHAIELGGDVHMPVMGSVIEQSTSDMAHKFILKSDSTKAHSPMNGTVYYSGNLKGYGLSVIVKNAHRATIIGNLDRSTVVKNQYLLQGDSIGSVAYHSNISFVVEQVQRTKNPSFNLIAKFQNKFLDFARKGKDVVTGPTNENGSLNYEQITTLLKDIGFPEKSIPTMVCIAKWESGLNPKALNFNTNNTVDVGLFQINSIWFKKCNTNLATLYDEKENSRCALTVLRNQGFPAWTTYNKFKHTADYCTM